MCGGLVTLMGHKCSAKVKLCNRRYPCTLKNTTRQTVCGTSHEFLNGYLVVANGHEARQHVPSPYKRETVGAAPTMTIMLV